MAAVPQPPVKRLLLAQLLMALLVTGGAGLIKASAALDALFGGLIAILPQLVFTLLAFRYRGARRINQGVQLLMIGATVKFGLTVVLFAGVFIGVQPSNPIFLLCAYIAVLSVHWLAPWLMQKKV